MGRPRGKIKKLNDESEEDGEEEEVTVSATPPPKTKRRRGRPAHKPLKDDGTDDVEAEEDKDAGELEEEGADGGAKPAPPAVRPADNNGDAMGSSAADAGAAKKRRRRPRRVKRGSDDDPVGEDGGVGEGRVRAKSSGFRSNGSRRKNTPRRAAEAGVECK